VKRALIACLFAMLMMWLPLPCFSGQPGGAVSATNQQGILDELLSIAAGGTRNADLYYNIGVCYFETGQPGKATLYYLKALAINSAHAKARANLRYLQDLVFMGNPQPNPPFLEHLLARLYDFLSTDRLALLCLILALFTVLGLHWLIHYPADRERALPLLAVMICLVLLLGSVVVLFVKQHRIRTDDTAVVVTADAPQFVAADASQTSERVAIEGTILHVLGREGGYARVRMPDATVVWLRAADLAMVAEEP